MEVQVISRKLIKPLVQTPPHLRNLKTSLLDQLAPSIYVPTIFYYPNNHETTKKIDDTVINERLEKSLTETLTLFYPLAGRYIHENLSVVCNDEGVEYSEAKVDGVDLSQILQQDPNSNLEMLHFIHYIRESDASPLLTIQVNKFRCGGLAIGLLGSDRVADMSTISRFINAWATASREGGISTGQVSRPSFDSSPFPFSQRDFLLLPPTVSYKKTVSKVFSFNKEVIDKLKSQVRGVNSAGGGHLIPSRLEVVIGLIWRALIGSAKAQHGHQLRASSLSLVVNLRGRLSMALPENACGNLFMPFLSRFDANESKLELSDIVSLIKDAKRKAISDCANAVNSNDVLSLVTNSYRELFEELNNGDVDTFMFTSWCRMGLDIEANFGWGKPAWMSLVAVQSSAVDISVLKDTKSGDGIEAWMNLKELDMLHFQQDPDIVALTSSGGQFIAGRSCL